jgi:hypothetical protein
MDGPKVDGQNKEPKTVAETVIAGNAQEDVASIETFEDPSPIPVNLNQESQIALAKINNAVRRHESRRAAYSGNTDPRHGANRNKYLFVGKSAMRNRTRSRPQISTLD